MKGSSPSVPRRDSGFTLIELGTSIAVIAILATLILTGFTQIKRSSQTTETISNMKSIYAASVNYAADNGGKIISPKFQTPGQDRHWHQILFEDGYLGDAPNQNEENAYRFAKVLSSPRLLAFYRGQTRERASIAMNERIGYRRDPLSHLGIGMMNQTDTPAKVMFLMEGAKINDSQGFFSPNIWPTQPPDPLLGEKLPTAFLDGHVEVLFRQEVPFADETVGENRLFWRGRTH